MAQILRFAVAAVEAREDAEDFRGALGRERGVDREEARQVEIRVGLAPRARVSAQQLDLHLFGHVDAGVLQQRS